MTQFHQKLHTSGQAREYWKSCEVENHSHSGAEYFYAFVR